VSLGSHTIIRIRLPERDKNGDPKPGTGSEINIEGCSVQPRQSTEATDLRNTVTTGLIVFAPGRPDILPVDRIRWDGVTYAVDGEPAFWEDLEAAEDHAEITLRRVEG
jgi:hypothetical protein